MEPRALRTDELDYHLPERLIATRPVEPRDSSRLLVMWRSNDRIEHRQVRDLAEYLHAGDALVFNNTAVVPARLVGRRADTGGKVEGLYLHDEETSKSPNVQTSQDSEPSGALDWRVMLKAGGKLQAGHRIELLDQKGQPRGIAMNLVRKTGAEWIVRVQSGGAVRTTHEVLQQVGRTPLPPYILHARGQRSETEQRSGTAVPPVNPSGGTGIPPVSDEQDRQWYQTIYAAADRAQSVAAPTAGLHFTPDLLQRLQAKGVQRIEVTLHVGPGTFKPVTAETLDQHEMHSEWYEVSAAALAAIRRAAHRRRHHRRSHLGKSSATGTPVLRTGRPDSESRGTRPNVRPDYRNDRSDDRAAVRIPARGWPDDQLPPAAVNASGAGGGDGRAGSPQSRVPGGDRSRLSLLLLRRRDVDIALMNCLHGMFRAAHR
jgi:S-adenosylmethionine:tRNA ribosyltransferase-isomerase